MAKARKLLYPVSLLYGGAMLLRNKLYDKNILKSHSFDLPVICVGNLSVGGTGKSPMVEYLISLLKEDVKIATLSRGYKRTTTGFHLLEGNDSAAQTGDEPLQFKTKFPEVLVAVDESRSHGIERLLEQHPKPKVIVLDDAFQHRKVSAGMNILLTPYDSLYVNDLVLPAGNLREPISGAKRAKIIVVTKCPENLSEEAQNRIRGILKLNEGQELFFTTVHYSPEALNAHSSLHLHELKNKGFTLVTGIAHPGPLVDYLKGQGLEFRHMKYPDHHNFSVSELQSIGSQSLILTTEKDYMRLKGNIPEDKLFYLPIKTAFLEGKNKFDGLVKTYAIKK